ncbi:MAG: twin-arginine translocase TatA/TatE family subunit [Cytophagales bacterium]|nr:twin-arginine translocase TatA/TatE family subunit [Cytophagales bacterium]
MTTISIATILFLGGIGATEAILIFCALVFMFGAKKIPELARGLGKGLREFKDASKEIKDNIEEGIKSSESTTVPTQANKTTQA